MQLIATNATYRIKESILGIRNISLSDFLPVTSNNSSSKMKLCLLLLMSCYSIMFCNVTRSQFNPSKLSELTTRNLFQLQLNSLKFANPVIAYDELELGRLTLFGYEIANLQVDVFPLSK